MGRLTSGGTAGALAPRQSRLMSPPALSRRAAMLHSRTLYIGLDVHTASLAGASVAPPPQSSPLAILGPARVRSRHSSVRCRPRGYSSSLSLQPARVGIGASALCPKEVVCPTPAPQRVCQEDGCAVNAHPQRRAHSAWRRSLRPSRRGVGQPRGTGAYVSGSGAPVAPPITWLVLSRGNAGRL
jgi:hypothetical protein